MITDSEGNVISRRDFLPFGEEITPDIGARASIAAYQLANAKKAASEIAGNMGSNVRRQPFRNYRGGDLKTRNSQNYWSVDMLDSEGNILKQIRVDKLGHILIIVRT
ncbi:MAG: hypothetical protein IPK58_02720 [Acidobacteria bacterium]|nr:hypothetical protein [Acidobacteriota bacterium]